MAKIDSTGKTIKRRWEAVKAKMLHEGTFPEAYRKYQTEGQMPVTEGYCELINMFDAAVKAMVDSMPGPHPAPPGFKPHPSNKGE
jgi:hypothetical protein